jgi:hypothetical protein
MAGSIPDDIFGKIGTRCWGEWSAAPSANVAEIRGCAVGLALTATAVLWRAYFVGRTQAVTSSPSSLAITLSRIPFLHAGVWLVALVQSLMQRSPRHSVLLYLHLMPLSRRLKALEAVAPSAVAPNPQSVRPLISTIYTAHDLLTYVAHAGRGSDGEFAFEWDRPARQMAIEVC